MRALDARNLESGFAISADLIRYTRAWSGAGNHASFPGFDEWRSANPQAEA
jgi:hypothetical protein